DATVAVVHGAFLLSLALGALWARKRIGSLSFAWIAALTGALALATLAGYGETFDVMQKSASTFAATSEGYLGFNLVKLLVAVAMIAPASFCGGVAYPLLTGSLQAQGHGERAAGSVLGVASLGALIGALVAMHVLIPTVGFKGVVIAGAAVHISIGALAIVRSSLSAHSWAVRLAAAAIGAMTLAGLVAPLDPERMTSGVYRTGQAKLPASARLERLSIGKTTTFALVRNEGSMVIAREGWPGPSIQFESGSPSSHEV